MAASHPFRTSLSALAWGPENSHRRLSFMSRRSDSKVPATCQVPIWTMALGGRCRGFLTAGIRVLGQHLRRLSQAPFRTRRAGLVLTFGQVIPTVTGSTPGRVARHLAPFGIVIALGVVPTDRPHSARAGCRPRPQAPGMGCIPLTYGSRVPICIRAEGYDSETNQRPPVLSEIPQRRGMLTAPF